MSGTGTSPFLCGEVRSDRMADEQWLLRFVTFMHQVMGRTSQGIRQRLSAVRYAHIAAGYPDPLAGRVRLWAALQGLARWETPTQRKVPVTPAMLRWILGYLTRGNRPLSESSALWASLCTGWFFMLRASEFLPPADPSSAPMRVMRGLDVEPFDSEQRKCSIFEATSVSIQIRQSKADQFGRGQVRIHRATGDSICPVKSLAEHAPALAH